MAASRVGRNRQTHPLTGLGEHRRREAVTSRLLHTCRIIVSSDTFSDEGGDDLHLDGCAERQRGHPDRASGTASGLAEDVGEQPAGTVDDARAGR